MMEGHGFSRVGKIIHSWRLTLVDTKLQHLMDTLLIIIASTTRVTITFIVHRDSKREIAPIRLQVAPHSTKVFNDMPELYPRQCALIYR